MADHYFIFIVLTVCLSACSLKQPTETPGTRLSTATPTLAVRQVRSWQIQFSGDLDTAVEADIYDVDAFDTDTATISLLHGQGRQVICYINAGAWEDWRPDSGAFPEIVIGRDYPGWAGEKWLDIRRVDLLGPIIQARLDMCKDKGFDGVEFDNVNGYMNDTGFLLTDQDQLAYNIWLAQEAHRRHLIVGLKNDAEQAAELQPYFDFAVVESCFVEGWCGQMHSFLEVGKAVFAIEYTDALPTLGQFCVQAQALHINLILKHRDLSAYRESCPSSSEP